MPHRRASTIPTASALITGCTSVETDSLAMCSVPASSLMTTFGCAPPMAVPLMSASPIAGLSGTPGQHLLCGVVQLVEAGRLRTRTVFGGALLRVDGTESA